MSNTTELPLSSLLEKANYIKKAMGDMEKNITSQMFKNTKHGIEVHIHGNCTLANIILDPTMTDTNASTLMPKVVDAVNAAINSIDERRQEAFKEISARIHDD